MTKTVFWHTLGAIVDDFGNRTCVLRNKSGEIVFVCAASDFRNRPTWLKCI